MNAGLLVLGAGVTGAALRYRGLARAAGRLFREMMETLRQDILPGIWGLLEGGHRPLLLLVDPAWNTLHRTGVAVRTILTHGLRSVNFVIEELGFLPMLMRIEQYIYGNMYQQQLQLIQMEAGQLPRLDETLVPVQPQTPQESGGRAPVPVQPQPTQGMNERALALFRPQTPQGMDEQALVPVPIQAPQGTAGQAPGVGAAIGLQLPAGDGLRLIIGVPFVAIIDGTAPGMGVHMYGFYGFPSHGGTGLPAPPTFGAPVHPGYQYPTPTFGAPAHPGHQYTPPTFGAPAHPGYSYTAPTFGAPAHTGYPHTPATFGAPAHPGYPHTPVPFGAPVHPGHPYTPATFGAPAHTGYPHTPATFGAPAHTGYLHTPATFGAPAHPMPATFGAPGLRPDTPTVTNITGRVIGEIEEVVEGDAGMADQPGDEMDVDVQEEVDGSEEDEEEHLCGALTIHGMPCRKQRKQGRSRCAQHLRR